MNIPSVLKNHLNRVFGEEKHPLILLEVDMGLTMVTLGFSRSVCQQVSNRPLSHTSLEEEWKRMVLEAFES